MIQYNYPKIYAGFIKGLPERAREVVSRRYGIKTGERETLESVGESFGITRERIRQIEEWGFSHIRESNRGILDEISQSFLNYFESQGGFKKESVALADLAGKNYQPHVFLLLTLGEQFSRAPGKNDYHSFWTTKDNPVSKVKNTLNILVQHLKKENKLLPRAEFVSQCSGQYGLTSQPLLSCLEISKRIQENKEGKIGLVDWPEIRPRGVKDKAFLVFKKENKPLHFSQVAGLIDKFGYNLPNRKTLPQTAHNELIKDPRFVLVGRGTYALKEWGYQPGTVKEVLVQVLKENKKPLGKEDLIKQVLGQRVVAPNTVLANLNDKNYFAKDNEGKYLLRKTKLV